MTNYAELTRLLLTQMCRETFTKHTGIAYESRVHILGGGYPSDEQREAIERLAVDHVSERDCMACGMTRIAMEAVL